MPPSLKRRVLDWVTLQIGIPLAYGLFRAIGWTLRHGREGDDERFHSALDEGKRFVFAFWHGDSFLMAHEMRHGFRYGRFHIMASQSRDGALMARFLRIVGVYAIRGSSSRGGGRALLGMIRGMGARDFAALAVDAPRGPRHRVNRDGILLLAHRTGLPIVPLAARAERKWTFNSWDRMEIPKPFSRTAIHYGEPLDVPETAGPEDFAALRAELERRLHALKGAH